MADLVRIGRKALHELVWAESVAHAAPGLGVWPRRLSDICRRNRIPLPDRAYWYCSRADRKALITPLPDADQDWEIAFTPSLPGPPKPEEQTIKAEGIVVPTRLCRPHWLVRASMAEKGSSCWEHDRVRLSSGCLDVLVTPACKKRAFRIMDTLIKACEARGWAVKVSADRGARTIVDMDGFKVGVELIEPLVQKRIPLPQNDHYVYEDEHYHPKCQLEFSPSGRLRLRIGNYDAWWHSGQWEDKKRRRLEDMLDDVIERLDGVKAAVIQQKKDEAEAAVRRQEEERRRREEEERKMARQRELDRIRRAEQARVDQLVADAEAWDQSKKIHGYIAAWISKAEADAGTKIAEGSEAHKWLAWARAQAEKLDPLDGDEPWKASGGTDDDEDDEDCSGLL